MSEEILSVREGHVLTISLNRPSKKNALSTEMYRALASNLLTAARDGEVHAVMLRGSSGLFCAGNDFADLESSPPASADAPVWAYFEALMHCPKSVLAAVDGAAVGVGTTTLLH